MILPSRTWPIVVALLLASAAGGHAQPTGSETIYHLHGTVINALTGKPLARALVTSGDGRLATMSGSEGQFAIDVSIPARLQNLAGAVRLGSMTQRFENGLLALEAQKPGYLPSMRAAFLPLDETLSTTSVQIKLMPAAIVTGRVSSAVADSAANVRVMLMRHQVQDGERIWMIAGTQETNSRGEFRFTDLRPGEYTVMTAEWHGDQQVPPTHAESTEHYPPVNFGDTRSLSTATKFHLHYGDTLAAEFHLHLATYYPVVVPISGAAGPVSAMLDSFADFQLGFNAHDNAVEGSLPNGDYTLMLTSLGPNPQQKGNALVPLHVAGVPVRTAPVALVAPGTIKVHIHTQFTKQENNTPAVMSVPTGRDTSAANPGQLVQVAVPTVQVTLISQESRGGYSSEGPNAAGDLTIGNVPPGGYLVRLQPFRGYIASATRGGIDLMQHPMIVGPAGGGEPIELTLRDDTATLNGTINYGTDPPQQSVIMFVPIDGAARLTQGYAGIDGKFTVPNLPPGSYRLLAFGSDGTIPQIAWHDAEEMHRYDGKSVTVTVAAGQTQTIEVRMLGDADGVDE